MKPLHLRSFGNITPKGTELDPALWPTRTMEDVHLQQPVMVSTVDPTLVEKWRQSPRFRRAGHLALLMAEACDQALNAAPELDRKRIRLVCAHFTGAIQYSRRFFQGILEQGAKFASPALFPETVYNSPTSHVVSSLELGGPVYSLIGDETALLAALDTASVWLELNSADAVLVVSAEELDPVAVEAYRRARWIQKGMIPTEGASAVLVTHSTEGAAITKIHSTLPHRNAREAREVRQRLTASLPEARLLSAAWNPVTDFAPGSEKHAFGASVLWQLQRHLTAKTSLPAFYPVLGCNHQSGGIEIAVLKNRP